MVTPSFHADHKFRNLVFCFIGLEPWIFVSLYPASTLDSPRYGLYMRVAMFSNRIHIKDVT